MLVLLYKVQNGKRNNIQSNKYIYIKTATDFKQPLVNIFKYFSTVC